MPLRVRKYRFASVAIQLFRLKGTVIVNSGKLLRRSMWVTILLLLNIAIVAMVAPRSYVASPCDSVRTTPYFTHYYGSLTLGSIAAPVGTVVQARDPRGDIVGCFVVQTAGYYGLMRVYGEDSDGGIPGMRDDETVTFLVSGEIATSVPAILHWHNDRSYHEVPLSLPLPGEPTQAASPSPTLTPTAFPTPTVSPTGVPPSSTVTATASCSPTPTPTPTPSTLPSATPSLTPTRGGSRTPTATLVPVPTLPFTPPPDKWLRVGHPGVYLAYDYTGHDPAVYGTVGSLAAFHWAQLENTEGQYTFAVIDNWLAKLDQDGLKGAFFVTLFEGGCNGDRALPIYIRNNTTMAIHRNLGRVCRESSRNWKAVPNYMDVSFQGRYRQLIEKLGEHYKNDPRLEFVAIGTGIYGETRAAIDTGDVRVLVNAGLNSDRWVDYSIKVANWYYDAFSDNQGKLLKPLLQQTGPYTFHASERRRISEQALYRGIGLSINAMYPDGEGVVYVNDPSCLMCSWYDFPMLYWDVIPTAWEAYESETCTPDLIWWGLYNILNKHPVYLRVSWPLLRNPSGTPRMENIQPFKWAAKFFGVTAETAPSAWVALREHRDPFRPRQCVGDPFIAPHHNPQWGNYGFFMDQRDDLPGGRTVPETNDSTVQRMGTNTQPYNPALPPGKEGWTTRRTDNETGNRYMFFDVDDTFARGQGKDVHVAVTYWDVGHDDWRLIYRDTSGHSLEAATSAGTMIIHKEDTRQWRTVMFSLVNANLTNSLPVGVGGADFAIDSMADGDEWIHFVEMPRSGTRLPPSTPTVSSTPLTTVTATTAAPPSGSDNLTKDLVVPYNGSPITIDGYLNEWEQPLTILDVTTADYVVGNPTATDPRVQMWGSWNKQTLNLAFRVWDDVLVADSDDIWRDDSIEIGIDADHDHHFTWNGPDYQFTVAVDGRWARLGHDTPDPFIKRHVRENADGWTVEIEIPWSVLGIPPGTEGRILGFTFAYHDDDDGGNWDSYLIWAGEHTNTSDADYGQLTLAHGYSITPTPTATRSVPNGTPATCFRRMEGRVFWDENADGTWQPGEQGLAGDVVLLRGPVSAVTTTREKGTFMFVGLPPGTYNVAATVPAGATTSTGDPIVVTVPDSHCAIIQDADIGLLR